MASLEFMQEVAGWLGRPFDRWATLEYPGYLIVDGQWEFGTANETWGGNRTAGSGESETYLETGLPVSHGDAYEVAQAIHNAISDWEDKLLA